MSIKKKGKLFTMILWGYGKQSQAWYELARKAALDAGFRGLGAWFIHLANAQILSSDPDALDKLDTDMETKTETEVA